MLCIVYLIQTERAIGEGERQHLLEVPLPGGATSWRCYPAPIGEAPTTPDHLGNCLSPAILIFCGEPLPQ